MCKLRTISQGNHYHRNVRLRFDQKIGRNSNTLLAATGSKNEYNSLAAIRIFCNFDHTYDAAKYFQICVDHKFHSISVDADLFI